MGDIAVPPRNNTEGAAVGADADRTRMGLLADNEKRISVPYRIRNSVVTKQYPFPVVHVYPSDRSLS